MLETLGGLRLKDGFRRVKPLLALAYVTLEGPTARRHLSHLLWPDAQQPDASLRVALYSLRSHLGPALIHEDPLDVQLPCDATQLLTLTGLDALHAYRGPFLHHVPLGDVSPDFTAWVTAQRTRLATHVQHAILQVAEDSTPAQAAALAAQAYRLPGAPPTPPELLHRILTLSTPGSALELDVRTALNALRPDTTTPRRSSRAAARMLGRAAELDTLLAWATTEQGGITLISGPGGIGKSTLARELLRELQQLNRPALLIDAEGITVGADLIPRVGTALNATPTPGTWAQLSTHLPPGATILLDGTDDLHHPAELLTDLRTTLPQVNWLLTSRRTRLGPEPLDIHPIHLTGLHTPPPEADLSDILDSPAVHLFTREAQRHQRTFHVDGTNAGLLAGITRRLQGHPLALTLAATWIQTEPLDAIHARILTASTTLHTTGTESARRGLDVIAQQSWNLLTNSQRHTLLRLSVFTDFDPAESAALNLPEYDVNTLLEHSFLEAHLPGSERLRLYPALQSAIAAQATTHPDFMQQARVEHAQHYLAWFRTQPPESPAIDAERGNLLLAMQHALRTDTLEPELVHRLEIHFLRRGLFMTGYEVFALLSELAVTHHAADDVLAETQLAEMWLAYRADLMLDAQVLTNRFLQGSLSSIPKYRMKALVNLAGIREFQGFDNICIDLMRQAVSLAHTVGNIEIESTYKLNLSARLTLIGEYEEAEKLMVSVEELLNNLPPSLQLRYRISRVWIELESPHPDYGRTLSMSIFNEEISQKQRDAEAQSYSVFHISQSLIGQGKYRAAQQKSSELIQICIQLEERSLMTSAYLTESRAWYALGKGKNARRSAIEGLRLALELRRIEDVIEALLVTADDIAMGDPQAVLDVLRTIAEDERALASQRRRALSLLPSGGGEWQRVDLMQAARRVLEVLKG